MHSEQAKVHFHETPKKVQCHKQTNILLNQGILH